MKSAIRERLIRLLSGMLLAFLGLLVIVPGAAVAGCSTHDRPTISLSDGSGIGLATHDRAGELAMADVTKTPRSPKPCTGAMCSGRPTMPVSPATPQILRIGLWAILGIATTITSPERTDSRRDDGRISPIRCSISIFHPPRLSPSHLAS